MSLPKVEDAFEVWVSRNLTETLPGSLHDPDIRHAFLAGAEYGAAAYSTASRPSGWPKCDQGDVEGDSGVCCTLYRGHEGAHIFPGDNFPPPVTDRYSAMDGVTVHTESAKGGRADSPAGEAGNFFEPKPPTWCRVQAQNTTRSIACGYRYGYEGKHSWEEGLRADYFVMDEVAKMSPAGDSSPVCAAVQFAGGLPCTFAPGHPGGMHSWNFLWANRAPDESAPAPSIPFHPKPPLGVMPQRLWKESRIKDLARAIHEYCESGIRIRPENTTLASAVLRPAPIGDWIHELEELWETL